MNVVSFSAACRDLMRVWMEVKQEIANGASGIAVCVRRNNGGERVIFAGRYEHDKASAMKAAMRMSWELTKEQDKTKTM